MTVSSLSVIVAVRNAMPYLPEAIAAILAQSISPVEILVVDGNSTDGTREIVATCPQLLLLDQQGQGLAAARNTGLAAARGDYIAFLDADDLWPADSLALRLDHLARRPTSLGVIGQVERFLQPGTPLPQAYAGGWLDRPAAGYTPGALLAHRRLFEQVGCFDESLAVGCDSEWFTRLLDGGAHFDVLPEVVLRKRIHDANLSGAVERYRRELLTITRRSLQRRGRL